MITPFVTIHEQFVLVPAFTDNGKLKTTVVTKLNLLGYLVEKNPEYQVELLKRDF